MTGSEGYIGSHLKKKIDTTTLDIVGNPDLKWDIRNRYQCHIDNVDTIIHLAALVRVGESVERPMDYYDTNVNGVLHCLKMKPKHFIFASTGAAEYGNSPYARSKRMAEDIIIEYCTKHNIDYTIFRFYNVHGCDSDLTPTNPDGLMMAIKRAIDTGTFNLYGDDYATRDGTCIRDYVHVNEICDSIVSAIDNPSNSIESLGHGEGMTVKEILEGVKRVNNVDFDIKICPRREGDLPISVLRETSKYMRSTYSVDEMLKL